MKFTSVAFGAFLILSSTTSSAENLTSEDMTKVLKNAVLTLSTLSGKALSSLNEVNIRFENFNKVAHVTMRSDGVTVKYQCSKDEKKVIECSGFQQSLMMDIVE